MIVSLKNTIAKKHSIFKEIIIPFDELTMFEKLDQPYYLTSRILEDKRDCKGFPIANNDDIIEHSKPPQFTLCPNPWLEEFISKIGQINKKDDYYCQKPFATDISEGKNDPIYNAHSFHTKVPYKAIMRYILHYTKPDDIVFDGFCGSGMTGIAAQMCGKKQVIEELGYIVDNEGNIIENNDTKVSKIGSRFAVLNDLSPIATFIAYNYNKKTNSKKFDNDFKEIITNVEKNFNWMYETIHTINSKKQYIIDLEGNKKLIKGKIIYTVWSDVFICPNCFEEFIFWETAVDQENRKVLDTFKCQNCKSENKRRGIEKAVETIFDDVLNKNITQVKRIPVLVVYEISSKKGKKTKKKRYEKKPDEFDLELIKKINDKKIPYWFPKEPIMFKGEKWGDTWRKGVHTGISHVHHFYTKRNLWILSYIFDQIKSSELKFLFTATVVNLALTARYKFKKSGNVPLTGTMYVSSLTTETNVVHAFNGKFSQVKRLFEKTESFDDSFLVSTSPASNLNIPSESIDYIFVDPPFGGNLMYSELSFVWESWLRCFTNIDSEAVINNSQKKDLLRYQEIMEESFSEFYRILKPGRWMTVEFHNSKNSVWMAIQEALQHAGFVVADVGILDKKQGTYKQVMSTKAVKQDLIISTYKPSKKLENKFRLISGTEEGVWDFISEHLGNLPVFVERNSETEIIFERQDFLLFDRMVAFHVQRGQIVPISASEFYEGLKQRFPERDGMYFLAEQVGEHDKKAIMDETKGQSELTDFKGIIFSIDDEKSCIYWLRNELKSPKTYQELQPKFLKVLHKNKHEDLPELIDILEQNFLINDDNKWFIPEGHKQRDLEKVREGVLLREFEVYRKEKGKLKIFRIEAIRAGFSRCWGEKDYETIVNIGNKIPDSVRTEDQTILMYYDNALTMLEGD